MDLRHLEYIRKIFTRRKISWNQFEPLTTCNLSLKEIQTNLGDQQQLNIFQGGLNI